MPDRYRELTPDQQAVLSLLIRQGRRYDQVGSMLGIPPEAVRGRAHAALANLAVPPAAVSSDEIARVGDYLLGQVDEAARIETLSALMDDDSSRVWAQGVSDELRAHATVPLPAVPDAGSPPTPDRSRAPRESPSEPAVVPRRSDSTLAAGRRHAGASRRPAPEGGDARRRDAGNGRRPDRGVAVLAAAAVLFVVAAVLYVTGSGSATPPVGPVPANAATATSTTAAGTTVTSGANSPQILDTLALAPASSGSHATGSVEVVKTSSGNVLVFTGSGLPAPGSSHYVLWLYKSASDYKALGLVPSITNGKVGPVQITLPADASNYTGVLLTLVSGAKASSAGSVVLIGNGSSAL